MKRYLPRPLTLLAVATLFVINVYIARDLFGAEFIFQMGSVEGSFIAISKWVTEHWGDLGWFPLWFNGMPFLAVYQPGFHVTVAGVAALFHLTPQHAYHLVCALVYCFQPIALFALCYAATGLRGYAFIAALVYSTVSPAAFLAPAISDDLGGLWFARRYQTLVHYGEGPHSAALLLIPLVILFLHRAATLRHRAYFPLACLSLASVVLVNWPGTIGLTMAVAAYCLSRFGSKQPLHWGWLAAAGVIAYMLACRWVPPSIILAVPGNAQQSDGTILRTANLWYLGIAVLVLTALHFGFEWIGVDRWLRFFLYFTLLSGTVVFGFYWFNVKLLPQPHRFNVEMEIGIIGAGIYLLRLAWLRSPRWVQIAALALLGVAVAAQIRTYRWYAHGQTLPLDITSTVEYRMSKWFEANMPGSRVFAPGSVSIWMNTFVDVPQVVGCCDQGVPTLQHRLIYYLIYTAANAGDRYVPASIEWLKAYGAQAIGVSGGPNSREFFKPYARPEAFQGALPVLWKEGGDIVYQVPGGLHSLAHVVQPSEIVQRPPFDGLDTQPLDAYVSALDRTGAHPASFRWINAHQARVDADIERGEVLSVQVTYNPGWHALVGGVQQPVRSDGLGLMVVEPSCAGSCSVDLVYDGGSRWTRWALGIGLVLCFLWPAWPLLKPK